MNYTPKIPKTQLIDGAYYRGECRNADVARWDGFRERFFYWRTKFGDKYVEEICCPEDDDHYDVFVAEELIFNPEEEIPLNP